MIDTRLVQLIQQQLNILRTLNEDLAYDYECDLYYDCNDDEESIPIIENFTPELLTELENLVNDYDQ